MQEIARPIRREVVIPSTDPALPDVTWVLEFDRHCLAARRKHSRERFRAPWRAVIGFLVTQGAPYYTRQPQIQED